MNGDTVNIGLCPGAVSLTDLGGRAALPHLVPGQAADGGLAPEAGALRPHLGLGGGGGAATAQGLALKVWSVPGNIEFRSGLSNNVQGDRFISTKTKFMLCF